MGGLVRAVAWCRGRWMSGNADWVWVDQGGPAGRPIGVGARWGSRRGRPGVDEVSAFSHHSIGDGVAGDPVTAWKDTWGFRVDPD